jgi:hypothetical protein
MWIYRRLLFTLFFLTWAGRGGGRGSSFSITLEPWGECTSSCVALRNVMCTDEHGSIAEESNCDGISDIKHYRVCNGGQCSTAGTPSLSTVFPTSRPSNKPNPRPTIRPTLKKSHWPTRTPSRQPTGQNLRPPSASARERSSEIGVSSVEGGDRGDDSADESGLVDPSVVLDRLIGSDISTYVPSSLPTFTAPAERSYHAMNSIGSNMGKGTDRQGPARNTKMAGLVTLLLLGLIVSIVLARSFLRLKGESVQYSKLNQKESDEMALHFPEGAPSTPLPSLPV